MLSLSLYFTGAFHDALHLFRQLTTAGSGLDHEKIARLRELSRYAEFECLRLNYWQGLKLKDGGMVEKELRKRPLDQSSIYAFHLFLANGRASEWRKKFGSKTPEVSAQITTRTNRIQLFSSLADADESIGPHLEVIQGFSYQFIPFSDLKAIEMGPIKRWLQAQVEFKDNTRQTVNVPLTYRDSMSDTAAGVQEGLETVFRPVVEMPEWVQPFGQKQFRSAGGGRIGLAEILRIEFSSNQADKTEKAA